MKTTHLKLLLLFFLTFVINIWSHAHSNLSIYQIDQKNIVDTTSTLLFHEIELLTQQHEQLKQKKNINLKIALISSTKKSALDPFGHQFFRDLEKNTPIDARNILLIISMNEKKLFAEVSPQLESEISQSDIDHIIHDHLIPKFQAGLYFEGLNEFQQAVLQQEHTPFSLAHYNYLQPIIYVYFLLSLISSAIFFWLFHLIILKYGYRIGLAFFSANLIVLIFLHVLMFNFYSFVCLSISLITIPTTYFLLTSYFRKYDIRTVFFYSLPFYLAAFYGLFMSLIFKILPSLSLIVLSGALLIFVLMSLYLTICYFFHYENGSNLIRENQRKQLIEKMYRTLNL